MVKDSGEEIMVSGLMFGGDQSRAVGGAVAPTQHAAQALQYELLAMDGVPELAEVSEVTLSVAACREESS